MMLAGAFAAVQGAFYGSSAWLGVAAAVGAAMLVALAFAFFVLRLRANLIVAGLAVNILAVGGTGYLLQVFYGTRGFFAPPGLRGLGTVHIPGLRALPILGAILDGHSPLVYITWALVLLTSLFLTRTVPGLRVRAVGEKPEAAATVGVPVIWWQYAMLMTSGALSGLAGAQMSLGNLQLFAYNMTNGRGFMALAAVFFGQSRTWPTVLGSVIFGFFDALQIRLQTMIGVPPPVTQMLPFIAIVAVLTWVSWRRLVGTGRFRHV
jgi:simple sugar transport system permease protein